MKTLLTAALLCGGLMAQAQVEAKTIQLGTVSGGGDPYFFDSFGGNHTVGDFVKIKLTSLSDITGAFFTTGIKGFGISLASNSFSQTMLGPIGVGTFSFANLGPGTYTFDVRGFTGAGGGAYLSSLNVAAVPEADTWLMILFGAGLVGLQLRRKQKGIERGPLQPAAPAGFPTLSGSDI